MKKERPLKIYLSGKISGLEEGEYQRNFAKATIDACDLFPNRLLHFINPTILPAIHNSWADYMIRDLMLLKDCDAIVMLPDWIDSKGATVEHDFALGCGMTIKYL